MGSWNYYIKLKVEQQTLDKMLLEYNQNSIYQAVFHFCSIDDSDNEGYNAIFVSVIDNFLPANHLIYEFLLSYASCVVCINTNGIEQVYASLPKKADFMNFMYDAWADKISFVYKQFGVIVVNQKHYCKIRNRLYRKYYIKFSSAPKTKHGGLLQ